MPKFVVLAVLLAAALAAPAQAATPFNAGTGSDPRIAVDDGGTGHIVFTADAAPDHVVYCRVPKGGSGCDVTTNLAFPAGTDTDPQGGRAHVSTPAAGKVVIAAGCWDCVENGIKDRVIRWISTNNGASFGAPLEITGTGTNDMAFSDGDGLWLDTQSLFVAINGTKLQALLPSADTQVTHSTFGTNYGPEVERVPGTNRMVTATNDLDVIRYTVFNGSALTANAINTQANWTGPTDLVSPEPDNSESGLISGPSGLYLHYKWFVAGNTRMGLRRFDGTGLTFGGPTYIDGENPVDDNSLDYPDAAQDGAGRVHAVWRNLHDGGRLRYTVSDTTGTTFSAPGTLAKSETFIDPEVAAAPDGSGFAVWSGIGESLIRVVPLDPQPEPVDPGPGPGPDPDPDPGSGGTTVTFPTDPASLPTITKSKRRVKVKVRGRVAAPAGKSCAGKVRITVKRGKKRIARKTTTVKPDCSYAKKIKIKRRKVKKAKRLKVILEFLPAAGSGLTRSKIVYRTRIR